MTWLAIWRPMLLLTERTALLAAMVTNESGWRPAGRLRGAAGVLPLKIGPGLPDLPGGGAGAAAGDCTAASRS